MTWNNNSTNPEPMKATTIDETILQHEDFVPHALSKREQIISYYQKAGADYYAWSNKYNMHFGYYAKEINPFNREAMLENLNEEVFKRLNINENSSNTIGDFGCGLGATLQQGAKKYPNTNFKGITIVPWQVEQARNLIAHRTDINQEAIQIIESDYCHTPFTSNSLDAVYAIESGCYAEGASKSDLLNEIHRVLKPGGRFVMADGFVKKPIDKPGLLRDIYKQLCTSWALTELANVGAVKNKLESLKFTDIRIEDISMKVAPSVAHVPYTIISFLLKELLFGKEPMNKERWNNLKSPALTMILGLARKHFGYYMVSGNKTL
jgi:MPBQ/MSBQ methyltransferase